ncbi:MAG: phosphoenolpyruvate carboxykinase (ATP) [Candidatus Omnitrophota bacterium]|nr:phosphoenolpyruvate carboxykinase (ATP) [Candidatus Omnitrophota bacterium]
MQNCCVDRVKKYNASVWLLNTGWNGGPYGVGERVQIPYTRDMEGQSGE